MRSDRRRSQASSYVRAGLCDAGRNYGELSAWPITHTPSLLVLLDYLVCYLVQRLPPNALHPMHPWAELTLSGAVFWKI
jgi:hypothetical protein